MLLHAPSLPPLPVALPACERSFPSVAPRVCAFHRRPRFSVFLYPGPDERTDTSSKLLACSLRQGMTSAFMCTPVFRHRLLPDRAPPALPLSLVFCPPPSFPFAAVHRHAPPPATHPRHPYRALHAAARAHGGGATALLPAAAAAAHAAKCCLQYCARAISDQAREDLPFFWRSVFRGAPSVA